MFLAVLSLGLNQLATSCMLLWGSLCRTEVLSTLVDIFHVEEGYHPSQCAASRAEPLNDTPAEGHIELRSNSIVVREGQVCCWSSYGVKESLKVHI